MKILTKEEAKGYSPTALAFYGDCAWESLVRRALLEKGNAPSKKLHFQSVEMVRASFQSKAAGLIENMFSQDEADIFRRGRNATGISVPKSSNPKDYHCATGLEALFGYLFLIGEYERANELFEVIWNEKQRNE
ncbi:MAG TPA: ribonuclease III [Ruminococcaceae bacterium]|nr:ribonuclease III [Oscillospiraceae bacterium]